MQWHLKRDLDARDEMEAGIDLLIHNGKFVHVSSAGNLLPDLIAGYIKIRGKKPVAVIIDQTRGTMILSSGEEQEQNHTIPLKTFQDTLTFNTEVWRRDYEQWKAQFLSDAK